MNSHEPEHGKSTEELVETIISGGRLPQGVRVAQEDYYLPIVEALQSNGGRLETSDAVAAVKTTLEDRLTFVDYWPLSNDEPRWRNTCRWARQVLTDNGVLDDGSPRGVWQLADDWEQAWEEFRRRRSLG